MRALAALDSVDVVTVNTATLDDRVTLYPGESTNPRGARKRMRYALPGVSWKLAVAPQVKRQRTGAECSKEDALHKLLGREPLPMRVILWNGINHFDAVQPL